MHRRIQTCVFVGLVSLVALPQARAQIFFDPAFGTFAEGGFLNGQDFFFGATGEVFEIDSYLRIGSDDLNGAVPGISALLSVDPIPLDFAYTAVLSDSDTDLTITYFFTNNTAGPVEDVTFFSFIDAEIDVAGNTFFNEFAVASTSGNLGNGCSDANPDGFEVDEPGAVFGDILDNLEDGSLDDFNAVDIGFPDDVSMALSFDLGTLGVGETMSIAIFISEDQEAIGSFSITHFDCEELQGDTPPCTPVTDTTLTLSGQSTLCPANSPPVCGATGPGPVECEGATTDIALDGSSSSDTDALTYAWTSDCPGGTFSPPDDDMTTLTVDSPGSCTATLTVTDTANQSDSCDVAVDVVDTTDPELTINDSCPLTIECGDLFTPPSATATDVCAGDVTGDIVVTDGVDPNVPGDYVITYVVSDGNGNETSESCDVTVVDTTDPTITINASCPLTIECGESFQPPPATAADDCAGDLTSEIVVTHDVDINTPGGYTVTYSVSDGNGNMAEETCAVEVTDTGFPTLVIAGPCPIEIGCGGSFTAPSATATDLCEGDLTGDIDVSDNVDVDVPGSYSIDYEVSDSSGNTAVGSCTVNVVSSGPPTLTINATCPIVLSCGDPFTNPSATATDSCGVDLTGDIVVSGSVDPNTVGVYALTYSVTDGSGSNTSQDCSVEVVSSGPPTLTINAMCPIVLSCGDPFANPSATATDSCGGDLTGDIVVSGSVDPNTAGVYALTYSVMDGSGDSTSQECSVEVVDNEPPTLAINATCPLTVECGSLFVNPTATASDTCAGDLDSEIVVSGVVDPNVVGAYLLSYSVSDGNGNTVSQDCTVNVVDTTPPMITIDASCPLTAGCGPFTPPSATAVDTCAGDLTGQISVVHDVDGSTPGDYTVTYSVSDGNGNSATSSCAVQVMDSEAPSLVIDASCPLQVECGDGFTPPTAMSIDSCDGDLSGSIGIVDNVDTSIPGIYTVDYEVQDSAGNVTTDSCSVEVVDTQDPTLTINASCPLVVICGSGFAPPSATASDICAGDLTGEIVITDNVVPGVPGTYEIEYSVSDGNGNSATETCVVEVVPDSPPTLVIGGSCPLTLSCGDSFTPPTATATDACGTDLTSEIVVTNNVNPSVPGTQTVVYSVTDSSGQTTTETCEVEVQGGGLASLVINAACPIFLNCGDPFSPPSATATAACNGQDLSSQIVVVHDVDPSTPGPYMITYSVSDGGTTLTEKCVVEVRDTEPPTLRCPNDLVRAVNSGCTFVPTDGGGASRLKDGLQVSDNCSAVGEITVTNNAPAAFPLGTTTVRWTATDGAGNEAKCWQTVTVFDDTAPTLRCPNDLVRGANVGCTFVPTDGGGASRLKDGLQVSDNCSAVGDITVTNNAPAAFPLGTTTVRWTATDGAGNEAKCWQTVTVFDDTAPTLRCPNDLVRGANVGCTFVPTDGGGASRLKDGLQVSDDCSGAGDITVTHNAPAAFPLGTTTVNWTATDAAGNVANCSQTVTVFDDESPQIACPAGVTLEANAGCSWTGDLVQPAVTDNCSGAGQIVLANDAPGSFPIGSHLLTWTAMDEAGNTASCAQEITVADTTPPTLTCPAPIRTDCTDGPGAVVEFTTVVSDTCDPAPVVVCTPPSGSVFPFGITNVVCTATDAAGNSSECEFQVNVTCGDFVVPGDCNSDGSVDVADGVCLLGYLFMGTVAAGLPCGDGTSADSANQQLMGWNDDGALDLTDAVSLLNWKFLGGPAHPLGSSCTPIQGCPEVCTVDGVEPTAGGAAVGD